jgi:hypothetical protein
MKLKLSILLAFALFHFTSSVFACQCPLTSLSIDECNKYGIIFRGRIIKDTLLELKKGEVIFEITELYKGIIQSQFKVLFNSGDECAQVFNVGEEWIIYTSYKQANNAKMDWCSRSRKYFKNEKLDFYAVTYGCSYDDELKFLRDKLGLHKPLKAAEEKPDWQGNQLPTQIEFIVYLLISIVGVVAFIYLVKRFLK